MQSKNKELSLSLKKILTNKTFLLTIFMIFVLVVPTFAQSTDTIEQLDNWGTKLINIFKSTWVKALLLVSLILIAIEVAMGMQQGASLKDMIGKFSGWIIGTIVLATASGICTFFLGDLNFEIGFVETVKNQFCIA